MDQRTAPQFSAQADTYPRVYRIGGTRKIVYLLLGGAALAGGLAFAAWIATHLESVMKDPAWFVPFVLCGLVLLFGAAMAVSTLNYRLILRADEIELCSLLSRRTMRRADVAGRRAQTIVLHGIFTMPYLFLVPKDDRTKKLRILYVIETDAVLEGWLASLPDLDKRQREEDLKEVLQNHSFGATEQARAKSLALARRAASLLNGAGAVLALGTMTILLELIPGYYWWLIAALAALPPLAVMLVIASNGLFCIEDEDIRNTARANLAALFIMAPLALTLRAWIDINVLDWKEALEAGALLGLAAALLFLPARGKGKYSTIMLLVFSLIWGSGAAVFYNSYFDRSRPSVFRTQIVSMHETNERTPSFRLKVQPWGPRTEPQDVEVDRSFYASVSPGMPVCIYLFNGALHIRWFETHHCL
ncbi:MAG: hypothetical protein ACLPX9_16630 [Rhodomicrobium sp.]